MRKLLFPLAGASLIAVALLLAPRAEATAPGMASGIRAAFSQVLERVACLPRRVCGFRGCRYRSVCKRSQGL
jgi:hypothetical protein